MLSRIWRAVHQHKTQQQAVLLATTIFISKVKRPCVGYANNTGTIGALASQREDHEVFSLVAIFGVTIHGSNVLRIPIFGFPYKLTEYYASIQHTLTVAGVLWETLLPLGSVTHRATSPSESHSSLILSASLQPSFTTSMGNTVSYG